MSKPNRSFRELRDDLAAQDESFRRWRESATDKEEELLFESLAKFYPDLSEAADADRRARGEPPIEDPEKIAKWRAHYEKAYYGKLRHLKKGREAVDFLRRLRMAGLLVAERVSGASDSEQGYERQLLAACEETFTLLEPLLNALPSRENPAQLDVEFLKALSGEGWQHIQAPKEFPK